MTTCGLKIKLLLLHAKGLLANRREVWRGGMCAIKVSYHRRSSLAFAVTFKVPDKSRALSWRVGCPHAPPLRRGEAPLELRVNSRGSEVSRSDACCNPDRPLACVADMDSSGVKPPPAPCWVTATCCVRRKQSILCNTHAHCVVPRWLLVTLQGTWAPAASCACEL